MKYGLSLANGGPSGDPQTLAEQSGWEGIFLEDYLIYQSKIGTPTYDPWIALAAIAARTERMRLGIMVTPLARRRPWVVAQEAVTLDHLSNGRLILGAGLGDSSDVNFTHFGEETDPRKRARMLDEALEILDGLWSGEPFSYEGEYYHVKEIAMLPRPVQQPRIPVWIGGGWPLKGPLERSVRWDGSCMYKHPYGGDWRDWTPEDIRSLRSFAESRRPADRPFVIAVGGRERKEDWDQERKLVRSLAEAGADWWVEWVAPSELERTRRIIEQGPLRID